MQQPFDRLDDDRSPTGGPWVPDPSRDAVTVLDRYLNVLDWNEQAEGLYGWTVGEAIGQFANELVPSATPWLHPQRKRELYRTGRYDGASLVIVKNGDLVAIEAVCVAIGREYFNVMRRIDPQEVALYHRIRRQLERIPEIKKTANSRAIWTPALRRRNAGGSKMGAAVQTSIPAMNATRQQTIAAARRELRERKTFVVRFRTERESRGWTQEDMGLFLGVRDKEINRYEHAHTWGRPPSERTRRAWAVQLGKPRDWLLPEIEPDERLEKLTREEEAAL